MHRSHSTLWDTRGEAPERASTRAVGRRARRPESRALARSPDTAPGPDAACTHAAPRGGGRTAMDPDPRTGMAVPASPSVMATLPAAPNGAGHRKGKSSAKRAHKAPLLVMAPASQLAFPRESCSCHQRQPLCR